MSLYEVSEADNICREKWMSWKEEVNICITLTLDDIFKHTILSVDGIYAHYHVFVCFNHGIYTYFP